MPGLPFSSSNCFPLPSLTSLRSLVSMKQYLPCCVFWLFSAAFANPIIIVFSCLLDSCIQNPLFTRLVYLLPLSSTCLSLCCIFEASLFHQSRALGRHQSNQHQCCLNLLFLHTAFPEWKEHMIFGCLLLVEFYTFFVYVKINDRYNL